MIHVIGDYYIDVTDNNYTLMERYDGIRKGEKKDTYRNLPGPYCASLPSALRRLHEIIMAREGMQPKDEHIELQKVAERIDIATNHLIDCVNKEFPKIKIDYK